MATARITKTLLSDLRAGDKDSFVWDDKLAGFGVKVTPSGSKVFIYQYRLGGRGAKVRRFTIGKFGPFTAEKARQEAEHLARLVAVGTDPQRDKKEQHRQAVELAFDKYLDRFETDCLKVHWPASHKDARATLDRFALPVLRSTPLPEITRRDIRAVLSPVKGKSATARKLFAILRRLFNFAVAEDDLKVSPFDGMESPPLPDSRDRVLEDWELALVWRAAGEIGSPFGPLVRLLILTGARREEVAGLRWDELREGEAMWHLPAERAKNGNALDLPLSPLAVDELTAMKGKGDKWPRRGLLFSTTGKTAVSGFSKAKSRLDAKIAKANRGEALDHWTLHDLRRTLATGMQRLSIRFEVTEAILNHVSGSRSGVAGIYQRHDWAAEKRAALDAWATHLQAVLTDTDKTNVVQLAGRRA
ncbi:integrase arm-type DNA-binding domain-containing protein [Altererythrobacter buctensis]|uniref:Integrase arm-type DNA-binding domain-containing protein n=2 Tax=Alteraurantiacibacter buctensis TaxID=1503981 RepID=A0A844YXH1_9SPHN|nr:integrase arm-type DNA-binding domain-containing protein [Alteraurantiacibacter buctensis]